MNWFKQFRSGKDEKGGPGSEWSVPPGDDRLVKMDQSLAPSLNIGGLMT